MLRRGGWLTAIGLLGLLAVTHADGPTAPAEEGASKSADNSACYECHDDYQAEPMVIVHFSEKVGCIDCHGESTAHCQDEETPPDVMFAVDKVNGMCRECHVTHNADATDVIARWQQRCPEKTDAVEINCTDCHFRHRLKTRQLKWNKRTGKLIFRVPKGDPTAAVDAG